MLKNRWISFSFRLALASLIVSAAAPAHALLDQRLGALTKPLARSGVLDSQFEAWLADEFEVSKLNLLRNIAPAGTASGAVVASPSRNSPNYFFHWVRDAALVMDNVVTLYAESKDPAEQKALLSMILDDAGFSRKLQLVPNRSGGLGEPKFMVDGSAYNDDWGRPQNDGPALRALTFMHFARLLLAQPGGEELVRERFYDSSLPATTLIKNDLEFVSHHWREKSFDLWEEVRGDHFYTRLVQRRSLVEGALFAKQMGDLAAADWYSGQAKQLEREIEKHWNKKAARIEPTLGRDGGIDYKRSGLDVAVVLAVLHAQGTDGYFGVGDERVQRSVAELENSFRHIFGINSNGLAGTAIGRYPEDTYDGYATGSRGNPWFLATLSLGEYYYRLAAFVEQSSSFTISQLNRPLVAALPLSKAQRASLLSKSKILRGSAQQVLLAQSLREKGDAFLERVRAHAARDGSLSEQMNRDTGIMQGAPDLTWSYAAFLTAYRARNSAAR